MILDLSLLVSFVLINVNSFKENISESFDARPYSIHLCLIAIEEEIYSQEEADFYLFTDTHFVKEINRLHIKMRTWPKISDGDFIDKLDEKKIQNLLISYEKRYRYITDIREIGGGMISDSLLQEQKFCREICGLYSSILCYLRADNLRNKRFWLNNIRNCIRDKNFYGKINLEMY